MLANVATTGFIASSSSSSAIVVTTFQTNVLLFSLGLKLVSEGHHVFFIEEIYFFKRNISLTSCGSGV